MSRFLNPRYEKLTPYTPGEQPQDRRYIKLNTNESPYPPSEGVLAELNRQSGEELRLYSDPQAARLKKKLADFYQVEDENIFVSNGSDEALNFAFMAFASESVAFADITYGFYRVFAQLHGLQAQIIPLREDFSLAVEDYENTEGPCVIANPNAPTGLLLPLTEIEKLLQSDPQRLVILDEAYIDFGGDTAVFLTKHYDNLLVIQTYSKSRSLAGARLGYAVGCKALIRDLELLRFATNPYNVNRLTLKMGYRALEDQAYYRENCRRIMETREYTKKELETLGFHCLDSKTNFLFAEHSAISGGPLYERLKERGILVRYFDSPRIRSFVRITIGSREEMEAFLQAAAEILADI